ncbi:MAG: STAS domain-containing protein [Gorillibacterium sp.]|nr:STAS domain-containing protein [Gorillibacterium sp.]
MSIEKKFFITKEYIPGRVIAHLHGDLDLSVTPKFRADLEPYINQSETMLELSFTNLTYIDSTGIGVIILILKQRTAIGGVFKITNVPKKIMKLFDITGISQHLDIENSMAKLERKEDVV